MRHCKRIVKLGRTTSHRNALLSSLVCNLIKNRRITTTVSKAKAASGLADKMVTLGKKNTLASRRQAVANLKQKDQVATLFEVIAPSFRDRNGGYTRVIKLDSRFGDNAPMAILEWIGDALALKKKSVVKKEEKEGRAAARPDAR